MRVSIALLFFTAAILAFDVRSDADCGMRGDISADAIGAGWSLKPPSCIASNETASLDPGAAPLVAPRARLNGTGGAVAQLPGLFHPAGGDPILADGEFFEQRTDAELAGYGGVHFSVSRTYRSRTDFQGSLGPGWDHNYNQRILGIHHVVLNRGEVLPNCDKTIDYQDGELNRFHFLFQYSVNGIDHYQASAGADLSLDSMEDPHTGMRRWRLTRSNGVISWFDEDGFLWRVQDPAGNFLSFEWALAPPTYSDDVIHGLPKHLIRVTDAARTINYIYDPTKTRLQCISLGNDCGTAAQRSTDVLVYYNYTPANGQLLASAYRGTDTRGETYSYFDQLPDAATRLDLGLQPADCVPNTDLEQLCLRLCLPKDASNPFACGNVGLGDAIYDYCQNVACYPKGSFPPDSPTNHCQPTADTCCAGVTQNSPDELCLRHFNAWPTCVVGCETELQCHHILGEAPKRYGIYSFGRANDLKHNIVSVHDERGGLIVENTYGEKPWDVSFDKVVSQQIGERQNGGPITFEYHDLAIEAQNNQPTIYSSEEHWAGPYSQPNPLVINPLMPSSTWIADDLCPSVCHTPLPGGGCALTDYMIATTDPSGILQHPTTAVVVHDLHDLTRIQYLDAAMEIVREKQVETNETSDVNYTRNGFVRGTREANGIRRCFEHDTMGRTTQVSVLPAAGYSGSDQPITTLYTYSSTGQVTDVVSDPLGIPVKTHYERDDKSRVVWTDQDVRVGAQALRTLYSYDEPPPTGVLETPSQITYANGRIDILSNFDPSMGGPRTIVVDASSQAPEQRYAAFDARGRMIEDGEVDRFAQQYQYDGGNRLTTIRHRLDKSSPWVEKRVASHDVGGEAVTDQIVEPSRIASYKYASGRYPYEERLDGRAADGAVPATTQTRCFNYSNDGRLEDEILPEGNSIHYQYINDANYRLVYAWKGYQPAATGDWAKYCSTPNPPPGDGGIMSVRTAVFWPSGFIRSNVISDVGVLILREYRTDGFGRIINSEWNVPNYVQTAVEQFGYDSHGRIAWKAKLKPDTGMSKNPYRKPSPGDQSLLHFSEYEYDLLGRVTLEKQWVLETGEAVVKAFDIDDRGSSVTINDRGAVTKTVLDGRGRATAITLPDRSTITTNHAVGSATTTVQSNQGAIQRTQRFDTRGLLLKAEDEKQAELYSASYNDDGDLVAATRAGMGTTKWTLDSFGRLVQEDQNLGATVATSVYKYDRNDRIVGYVDAEQNSWSIILSGYDQPLTITDPEHRVGTYVYEGSPAHPARVVEPNGRHVSFDYDFEFHLENIFEGDCPARKDIRLDPCTPLAPKRHFSYSAEGQLLGADAYAVGTSPAQASVTLSYDSLSRLIDQKVGSDIVVHHAYADEGRTETTQLTYLPTSAFASMTHRFDQMDRLAKVDLNDQTMATYDYGIGIGGPKSLSYSNGAKTAYTYDSRLRQTKMEVTFTPAGSNRPTTVASLTDVYGRDSIPRMRQRKIGTGPTLTDVYQVDADGRIQAENLTLQGVPLLTGEIDNAAVGPHIDRHGPTWRTWDIDRIGNIKKETKSSSALMHEIDRLSRLKKVGASAVDIDQRDNLQGTTGGAVHFEFDSFSGNLTSASNGATKYTYEYDALDRRLVEHRPRGKQQLFVWDEAQLIAHGNPSSLTLDVPGNDIDEHIAAVDEMGAGSKWFYHQGSDMSVLAVTGSAGLIEGYSYSSLGDVALWNTNGRSLGKSKFDNPFMFQGQLYDSLTSTYSMRARQYQPKWGRFLSADPLSFAAAPSLYSFTGARPLSYRDPLGLAMNSGGGSSKAPPCTTASGIGCTAPPKEEQPGGSNPSPLGPTPPGLVQNKEQPTFPPAPPLPPPPPGGPPPDGGFPASFTRNDSHYNGSVMGGRGSGRGGVFSLPPDRVFAGPVGWVVRILSNGGTKIIKKIWSKEEARILRKQGKNVMLKSRQFAGEVENAAANGAKKDVLRHSGHDLANGSKGMPHYQNENRRGHSFWKSIKMVIGGIGMKEIVDFLDPTDAIAGDLANGELPEGVGPAPGVEEELVETGPL